MSRCFPFPPPGYEKKLRVDVTLLAKEKDEEIKERRHKKDKNKEKKEGREKDREKSKERHKEKDKEKHRYKDGDKKNGKKRSRDEKRFSGDKSNVEKLGSNSPESSCVQELKQSISFVDGATGSQSAHTVYDRDQAKAELCDGVANRNNGAYYTEAKRGLDQMANGQRDNCHSKFQKVVFSNGGEQRTVQIGRADNNINESTEGKDMQNDHNSLRKGEKSKDNNVLKKFGYHGAQIDLPREAEIVEELDQRVGNENGAIGSQNRAKANVTVHKRAENSGEGAIGSQIRAKANLTIQGRAQTFGEVANVNAITFSQIKENSKIENGSYRLENEQKDGNQSKVPKVAVVHNFKMEERGCEMAGGVNMSKESPLEVMSRNGYHRKSAVDIRKKIQSKEEDGTKSIEEKVKEESDNVVKLSRIRQNSNGSIDKAKHYTFKMSNKTEEVITGKRKEAEANGNLHDHETWPSKLRRTVLSSQPSTENGRNLKTSTTISLSTSKKELKPNLAAGAQSPLVSKPMGPTHGQSPLGLTKPCISAKPIGEVGSQGSPFGSTKPPFSVERVHGLSGSQESHLGSIKPPLAAGEVNGMIRAYVSPPMEKAPETVGCQEAAKPPLTPGKVNGTIRAHGSPSRKEKRKHKSSSKPLPPHRDTKYLSEILSVPKVEGLSEFDDPEWLLESKSCSSKEHDVGYGRDGGEQRQVWDKAFRVEYADVYALPYVIPY